jgi:hypothetical protein
MKYFVIASLSFASSLSAYAQAFDLLSPGVVLSGNTTFEVADLKSADPEIQFRVENAASGITIRLSQKYAADKTRMSHELYNRLVVGGPTTIRFAETADIPIGAELDEILLLGVMQCLANPIRRDERLTYYALRCIDVRPERRATNADGRLVYEVDAVVSTPNQSSVDRFILAHLSTNGGNVLIRAEK